MLTCPTDADTNRVLLSQALVASLSSLDAALCCRLHVCVAGSARATTDNNRCVAIDSLCARQHGLDMQMASKLTESKFVWWKAKREHEAEEAKRRAEEQAAADARAASAAMRMARASVKGESLAERQRAQAKLADEEVGPDEALLAHQAQSVRSSA